MEKLKLQDIKNLRKYANIKRDSILTDKQEEKNEEVKRKMNRTQIFKFDNRIADNNQGSTLDQQSLNNETLTCFKQSSKFEQSNQTYFESFNPLQTNVKFKNAFIKINKLKSSINRKEQLRSSNQNDDTQLSQSGNQLDLLSFKNLKSIQNETQNLKFKNKTPNRFPQTNINFEKFKQSISTISKYEYVNPKKKLMNPNDFMSITQNYENAKIKITDNFDNQSIFVDDIQNKKQTQIKKITQSELQNQLQIQQLCIDDKSPEDNSIKMQKNWKSSINQYQANVADQFKIFSEFQNKYQIQNSESRLSQQNEDELLQIEPSIQCKPFEGEIQQKLFSICKKKLKIIGLSQNKRQTIRNKIQTSKNLELQKQSFLMFSQEYQPYNGSLEIYSPQNEKSFQMSPKIIKQPIQIEKKFQNYSQKQSPNRDFQKYMIKENEENILSIKNMSLKKKKNETSRKNILKINQKQAIQNTVKMPYLVQNTEETEEPKKYVLQNNRDKKQDNQINNYVKNLNNQKKLERTMTSNLLVSKKQEVKKTNFFELIQENFQNDQKFGDLNQIMDNQEDINMRQLENQLAKDENILNKNDKENDFGNENTQQYLKFLKSQNLIQNQIFNQDQVYLDLISEEQFFIQSRIAQDFEDKLKYIDIYKNAHKPKIKECYQNDLNFQFFKHNLKNNALSLPLFEHVFDQTLCLQNYRISNEICFSLTQTFQYFQYYGINHIFFENCCINDFQFSHILRSISQENNFKKFIYKRNEFSYQSLKEIPFLIQKKNPFNLQELRIEGCPMAKDVIKQLTKILCDENYLQKLALVEVGIQDDSIKLICELFKNNSNLIEIDLSKTKAKPQSFLEMLEILKFNKRLRYVNISNNLLISLDFSCNSSEMLKQEQKIIDNLAYFIKRSPSLLHLNICNTGLNEIQVFQIGKSLRRSRSLQAIHLSGNEINQRLINDLIDATHGVHFSSENFIMLKNVPSYSQFKMQLQNIENNVNDKKILEILRINYIQKKKKIEQNFNLNQETYKDKNLIITRNLGHKIDIPGSGQWRLMTDNNKGDHDCWICDKQIYSLIFWNELIGYQEMDALEREDDGFITRFFKKNNRKFQNKQYIKKLKDESKRKFDPPFIYGQFTGWKPVQMFDIRDFCHQISNNKADILQICKEKKLIGIGKLTVESLNRQEMKIYKAEQMKYYEQYQTRWRKIILNKICYKQPNLINAGWTQFIDNLDYPLYVFPTFLKSGKHYYIIDMQDWEQQIFYGSFISSFRQEEVSLISKEIKMKEQVQRKFDKGKSVFSKWKVDDSLTLKKCLEHDMKFWKLQRFIKDQNEYQNLFQIIQKNYQFIKDTHIYQCANSIFPATDLKDFLIYAQQAKIFDKNLSKAGVVVLFIAANYEIEDQNENPDQALIRFEYIELLVRIAIEKYKKTGECKTASEAFDSLLQQNIHIISQHKEWQYFRETYIWTLEVNDVLDYNLDLIKKIYDSFLKSKQQHIKMDQAIDLFTKNSDCCLSYQEAVYCYGMSKMTVANENAESALYKKMSFVEFLEMICRAADTKFKSGDQAKNMLHKKVEIILDELFVILGRDCRRREVQILIEENSQSDSDY